MHICSGSWQSRLKPNTKQVFSRGTRRPGCSQHSANPSRKSRCRAAKSTAETGDRPKLEKVIFVLETLRTLSGGLHFMMITLT